MANLTVRRVTYNAGKVTVEGSAPTTATVRVLINPHGIEGMTPQQIFDNYDNIRADGKGEKANAGDFTIPVEVGGSEPYVTVTVTNESKIDEETATPSQRADQTATRPGSR
jgi:hypothetical protein